MKSWLKLDPDMLSAVGKASLIGFHMVSGILVGSVIGWFLDAWLGTSPWLLLLFFILGVAAGFRNVWREVQGILHAQERSDRHSNTPESDEETKQP